MISRKVRCFPMAYRISDACVGCGSCAALCPVEAIKEQDGAFVIDTNTCVECGSCEANCPTEAIVAE
jgi:NAD-dependent dihydropyrimidine dehydrogenase PreA subunit